jgi:hypothetical protein
MSGVEAGVKVFGNSLKRDLKDIDRRMDKATMWALRETGRVVKRTASRGAPRYRGPARKVTYGGNTMDLQPGMLRKSIRSSKRLKKFGDTWAMSVGPRGYSRFYAKRMNERHRFMESGMAAGIASHRSNYERAWTRAMKK